MSHETLRERLRTVHVIPLTPFDDRDRVAEDVLAAHFERLAAGGVRVLVCGAGTSEFHALRPAEIGQLVRVARATVGERVVVFGSVGFGIEHALDCGRSALTAGADGVMAMPPLGPYLSDEGLGRYYRRLLDELDCPLAVYRRTPLPGDELLAELAADERVVAVKEATDQVLRLAQLTSRIDQVTWICGNAERWAPFYALAGTQGFTSGTANLVPRLALKLHDTLARGDFGEAMRLREAFCGMEDFRAEGATSYNIAALKHAMRRLGAEFGPARPPMRLLTTAEEQRVDRLAEALLAFEREECD